MAKKNMIFLEPLGEKLSKLKEMYQELGDEKLEILTVNDIAEASQLLGTVAPALWVTGEAKKCLQLIMANKKVYKKTKSKVILLSEKKLPAKATKKIDQLGITVIYEPVIPKTLQYKVDLLLRSLPTAKKDNELTQKSLEGKIRDQEQAQSGYLKGKKRTDGIDIEDDDDIEKQVREMDEQTISLKDKKKSHLDLEDDEEENKDLLIEDEERSDLSLEESRNDLEIEDEDEKRKAKASLDIEDIDEAPNKSLGLDIEDQEGLDILGGGSELDIEDEEENTLELDDDLPEIEESERNKRSDLEIEDDDPEIKSKLDLDIDEDDSPNREKMSLDIEEEEPTLGIEDIDVPEVEEREKRELDQLEIEDDEEGGKSRLDLDIEDENEASDKLDTLEINDDDDLDKRSKLDLTEEEKEKSATQEGNNEEIDGHLRGSLNKNQLDVDDEDIYAREKLDIKDDEKGGRDGIDELQIEDDDDFSKSKLDLDVTDDEKNKDQNARLDITDDEKDKEKRDELSIEDDNDIEFDKKKSLDVTDDDDDSAKANLDISDDDDNKESTPTLEIDDDDDPRKSAANLDIEGDDDPYKREARQKEEKEGLDREILEPKLDDSWGKLEKDINENLDEMTPEEVHSYLDVVNKKDPGNFSRYDEMKKALESKLDELKEKGPRDHVPFSRWEKKKSYGEDSDMPSYLELIGKEKPPIEKEPEDERTDEVFEVNTAGIENAILMTNMASHKNFKTDDTHHISSLLLKKIYPHILLVYTYDKNSDQFTLTFDSQKPFDEKDLEGIPDFTFARSQTQKESESQDKNETEKEVEFIDSKKVLEDNNNKFKSMKMPEWTDETWQEKEQVFIYPMYDGPQLLGVMYIKINSQVDAQQASEIETILECSRFFFLEKTMSLSFDKTKNVENQEYTSIRESVGEATKKVWGKFKGFFG